MTTGPLDSATVAPEYHRVLFDNEEVRVLYSTGTPRHMLENTGADDLVVIGVELKRAAQAG